MLSLVALMIPALGLPLALVLLEGRTGLPSLFRPGAWPFELWVIACCGIAATISGLLDHHYHKVGGRPVSRKERRSEWCALGVGAGVFALMARASISSHPESYLLPVLVLALGASVLICYDEFHFHRSCTRYETMLHRVLVFGNGAAWLSWCHWCFVRERGALVTILEQTSRSLLAQAEALHDPYSTRGPCVEDRGLHGRIAVHGGRVDRTRAPPTSSCRHRWSDFGFAKYGFATVAALVASAAGLSIAPWWIACVVFVFAF